MRRELSSPTKARRILAKGSMRPESAAMRRPRKRWPPCQRGAASARRKNCARSLCLTHKFGDEFFKARIAAKGIKPLVDLRNTDSTAANQNASLVVGFLQQPHCFVFISKHRLNFRKGIARNEPALGFAQQ